MVFKKFILCFAFLLLIGCSTSYKPDGLTGGYRELQLNKDMYRVSFKGNGYTSSETVQNYLLRRCAELTLKNKYKYFIILDSKANDNISQFTTPTTVTTTGYGNLNGYGHANTNYYGNNANTNYSFNGQQNYNSNTTIHHGDTYTTHKHAHTVIMKMLKTNKNIPFALNAKLIMRNTGD